MLTAALLERYHDLLRESGARIADLWRPQQRTREEVTARIRELGLELPAELAVWWQDVDGVRGETIQRVSLRWSPLSVDEAVTHTLRLRQTFVEIGEPYPWSSDWLAFAYDGSRGWLVCDGATGQDEASPVYAFWVDDWVESLPALPSIGALVSLWTDALRDRTLHVVDGQFQTADLASTDPQEASPSMGIASEFL